MNKRLVITLITVGILIILTPNVQPAVIWGIGELNLGGWDFSEQKTVHPDDADIFVAIVVDPPLGWVVGTNYSLVAEIPDSTFEELKYAPADTTLYDIWAPASLDRVYVVRTREFHYAKFRFLELGYHAIVIEYVYQPDGTRKLFDIIGVDKSTWGHIKNIFR